MLKRINMCEDLLNLIIMVQNYRKFISSQSAFNGTVNTFDAEAEAQKFLNTIDSERLSKYNLSKNNYSIEKILRYPVTNEILNTEYKDLWKFNF